MTTTTPRSVSGTRSSHAWSALPGRVDATNIGRVFPSGNRFGIPDLEPTSTVPSTLAAWHAPRQRAYAAEHGGAVHCFLDDYRFETAWSSPLRAAQRVTAVGVALSPDFSLWRGTPLAAQLWNVYRSRWCGALWRSLGVDVVPTVSWSDAESYAFAFAGLPTRSTLAVSAVGVRRADAPLFRAGLEQLFQRCQPTTLLVYGQLRWCDGLTLPDIVEYPTWWDRRRSTSPSPTAVL